MTDTARALILLPPVAGLEAYWRAATFRGERYPAGPGRLLLDALGLGLEQTVRYLGSERPDLATFERWVVDMAGMPDPLGLARYHAALAGEEPPAAVQAWLAAVDAAAPVLGDDDLARWHADGVVIVRQAITAAEAAAAAQLLWDTVGARPDDPDGWYGPGRQGIMVQRFQHSAMEPARRSRRVHKAFAQLWNTADLWVTVDRMSFNPPERPGRPFPGPHLHWDVSLARPIPFATQGMVYLTDTAAEQGALRVVPGFHHRIDGWLDSLGDTDPRTVDLDDQTVAVAANAGDLVIWRQDLPHGASPNTTDQPRMAQYVTMYPASLSSQPVWI